MATNITIGASTFKVYKNEYVHTQTKFYSEQRTITGALDRLEANIFENRYRMVIMAASQDVTNLRTLYGQANASASTNKINFIDLEGRQWSPSSAGGGILNTGVYFNGEINVRPMQMQAWTNARFLVGIELVVIATGMAAS